MSGGGFLGDYVIGALECLKKSNPHMVSNAILCGASMGALIAACEACDVSLSYVRGCVHLTADSAHKYFLGPFSPSYNIEDHILKVLRDLPLNAHKLCNGRLVISITERKGNKNLLVNEWMSRDDLIKCLLCSCFIPVFSGMNLPTYRGIKCMDGAFSCNLPIVPGRRITISPFYDKSDISPKDKNFLKLYINTAGQQFGVSFKNVSRFFQSVYPPSLPRLDILYALGYSDATKYLISKGNDEIN